MIRNALVSVFSRKGIQEIPYNKYDVLLKVARLFKAWVDVKCVVEMGL